MMNDELLQISKKENSQLEILYVINSTCRCVLHLQTWSFYVACTYKYGILNRSYSMKNDEFMRRLNRSDLYSMCMLITFIDTFYSKLISYVTYNILYNMIQILAENNEEDAPQRINFTTTSC